MIKNKQTANIIIQYNHTSSFDPNFWTHSVAIRGQAHTQHAISRRLVHWVRSPFVWVAYEIFAMQCACWPKSYDAFFNRRATPCSSGTSKSYMCGSSMRERCIRLTTLGISSMASISPILCCLLLWSRIVPNCFFLQISIQNWEQKRRRNEWLKSYEIINIM